LHERQLKASYWRGTYDGVELVQCAMALGQKGMPLPRQASLPSPVPGQYLCHSLTGTKRSPIYT